MSDDSLEKAQKYQSAFLHAGMGLWELDVDTKILSWDEGFRRLHELNEGEYSTPLDLWMLRMHPDDRILMKKKSEEVMSGKADVNFKYRVITKLNKTKYVRVIAYTIKEHDKVKKIIGLHSDVTSESLLEIELTKAKEFTENILDAIPDVISVKNQRREILYANSEFEKFVKMTKDKIIGKTVHEVLPKEVADRLYKQDSEIFEKNISTDYETTALDLNGVAHTFHTRKTLVTSSTAEKLLLSVAHDITYLKNIQNSLIEQSKMASLGEMAAEIAHEVNNPLTIIQGKTQLLLSKIGSSNVNMANCKNDMEQIEKNCIRIDKIIKSLKAVTRKADLDPFENVSILKLIDEALEICSERFRKRKINLFTTHEELITSDSVTRARPSEVVQVLVNLLNNSYDAIQNHDRAAWCRVGVTLQADMFLVEVMDSGSEIEPEVVQKMMDPFFTTKLAGKGTGLGLSVSKQIINNHGGDLYYDSLSENTRFVFTLPKL